MTSSNKGGSTDDSTYVRVAKAYNDNTTARPIITIYRNIPPMDTLLLASPTVLLSRVGLVGI